MAAEFNLTDPSKFDIATIKGYRTGDELIPFLPHVTILLGAGASKEWGMPLIRDFEDEAFIREVGGNQAESLLAIVKECVNPTLGFEQSLRNAFEEKNIQHVDKLLDLYFAIFLAAETTFGTSKPREVRKIDYLFKFLAIARSYATPRPNGARLAVSIIDFNHDLLIELSSGFGGFHYGSLTFEMCMPKGIVPGLPSFSNEISLLKPHGSFNWAYCSRCFAFLCCADHLWAFSDIAEPCPNCGSRAITRAYHPPSPKQITPVFMSVWQDIREVLLRTHLLIAIGYSFPGYDVLLRKTISDYLMDSSKVLIVDPYSSRNVENYSFLPQPRFFIEQKFSVFVDRWFHSDLFMPDWGQEF